MAHKNNSSKNKAINGNHPSTEVNEPLAVYQTLPSAFKFLGSYNGNGKKSIEGKFDFIDLIRKGVSRKALDFLMETTGITPVEMASIMHTSDRTLRRYTASKLLNPEQSERVIELARLYSRGEDVFGSLDAFKEWIDSSVIALGNKKPKEFFDTSLGIELLMEELGRIEHGVFA